MNPNLDVRIDSMMRAVSDFIIPELRPGGPASEQAALMLAHLAVLRSQVDLATAFERYELSTAVELGRELVTLAHGNGATTAAAERLQAALAEEAPVVPRQVRASLEAVRAGIEDLIRAAAQDGAPGVPAQIQSVVVRSEIAQANANRALFAGNGWESGETVLPELEPLLFGTSSS